MFLFVYGSLMRTGRLHHKMGNATYMCDGYIDGALLFDLGGTPALKIIENFGSGYNRVYGELFDVDDDHVFNVIDQVEGHPNLYQRMTICYYGVNRIEAYCMNNLVNTKAKCITSGIWKPQPSV